MAVTVQDITSEVDARPGGNETIRHGNINALSANGRIKKIMYFEADSNVASLVDAAGATVDFTATGVALGDVVIGASCSVDLQDMLLTGYVDAADSIQLRVQNESGSTVDLASATFRILVADLT